MNHRLTQHRHHHPNPSHHHGHGHNPQAHSPPVQGDLRDRLNRMREQREQDEQEGILPPEDSYIHNMPRHQRHAGFPNERNDRRATPINRPLGKVEWDEGKALNIKIQVSESGERAYKVDKEDELKVQSTRGGSGRGAGHPGKVGATSIIRNENEPGMKTRGRGGYRGAPRARGYYRGRGRGGYRGGRKPRNDRDKDNADGSSTSSATNDAETTDQQQEQFEQSGGEPYEGGDEAEGEYHDNEHHNFHEHEEYLEEFGRGREDQVVIELGADLERKIKLEEAQNEKAEGSSTSKSETVKKQAYKKENKVEVVEKVDKAEVKVDVKTPERQKKNAVAAKKEETDRKVEKGDRPEAKPDAKSPDKQKENVKETKTNEEVEIKHDNTNDTSTPTATTTTTTTITESPDPEKPLTETTSNESQETVTEAT